MILIKENSVPKIHEIVKVAMNRKRGLNYVVDKLVDAIDGVYNPHSSEDDKDLAFLIHQYGGPGLLEICHRALGFSSTSTSYRLLQKSKQVIHSSVVTPIDKFIDNIEIYEENPKYGFMLEIDETYTDKKVRWNPRDNRLYGFCYEHGRFENLEFTDYDSVENLSDMVKNGLLHVPKESMVVTCSSNSVNCKVQVVAALPTCSKKEIDFQASLIDKISTNFVEKNGAPLLNWSTDGDATRRRLFDGLMSYDLSISSAIYPVISRLRLMDTKVGRNEETVNFDAKHITKRIRTSIIGGNFSIGDVTLTKGDVEKVLSCAPNEFPHSTAQMLNPLDKQNAPLATSTLLQFQKAVLDVNKLKSSSFRIAGVSIELFLFSFVIDGILLTYTNVKLSIKEQLETISLAAHILLILQRTLWSFIPNQLYHDIQASFEDAFYCAAKWKVHHPDLPLYLMLCSNDIIERP